MESHSQPNSQGDSSSRSISQSYRSEDDPLCDKLSTEARNDDFVKHHGNGERLQFDGNTESLYNSTTERKEPATSVRDNEDSSSIEEKEAASTKDSGSSTEETTCNETKNGISYRCDVEEPPSEKKPPEPTKDPNLVCTFCKLHRTSTHIIQVTWDSDDDPQNPKNCKKAIILRQLGKYIFILTC